jgi:hypothetical protein
MVYDDRRQRRDSASKSSASCLDTVPALTAVQQREIGHGRLFLDQLTKGFIHGHPSYRSAIHGQGAEALSVERAVRAAGLPAGGRTSTRCEQADAGTIRANDAAGALWSAFAAPRP